MVRTGPSCTPPPDERRVRTFVHHVDDPGHDRRARAGPPRPAQRSMDREVVPRRLRLRPRRRGAGVGGRDGQRLEPGHVAETFGGGFWDLATFTLQMAMSCSRLRRRHLSPVARLIERIARWSRRRRAARWRSSRCCRAWSRCSTGASRLVFSGLLARAIARRGDLRADYRALGAAAYLGLGAVWALGLSSSAAQLQATPASLPPELLEITASSTSGPPSSPGSRC